MILETVNNMLGIPYRRPLQASHFGKSRWNSLNTIFAN